MFGLRNRDNHLWKLEYTENLYKIYDWDKNLTGYFFPNYNINKDKDNDASTEFDDQDYEMEDKIIEQMIKRNQVVKGGNLLLPMIKLDLLDNNDGIDLDFVISSLEQNAQRTKKWKRWLSENHTTFNIVGSSVYTAREDRNILSIFLGVGFDIVLGEKEIRDCLRPLLDKLHTDELI